MATVRKKQSVTLSTRLRRLKISLKEAFRGNFQLSFGLIIFAILVIAALLAPVLATHDPYFMYPSLQVPPGTDGHILGTDNMGRDIFSQLLYGARTSLVIGLVAASISGVLGTLIGGISGYFGGVLDRIVVEFINIFVMTPSFFLILIIVSLFGSDIRYVMLVVGLTSWPGNARLMRAQAISLRERTFVKSSIALGENSWQILFKHIIPNGIFPIIANTTMQVSGAILTESGLSFLGLGDPNIVSWGKMISQGQPYLTKSWWISVLPGLIVVLTVLAFFLIGDGLKRVISPKIRSVQKG